MKTVLDFYYKDEYHKAVPVLFKNKITDGMYLTEHLIGQINADAIKKPIPVFNYVASTDNFGERRVVPTGLGVITKIIRVEQIGQDRYVLVDIVLSKHIIDAFVSDMISIYFLYNYDNKCYYCWFDIDDALYYHKLLEP